MSLIESVPVTRFEARADRASYSKKLRMYALSTCAFCEDAIAFLKEQGLAFEYIFIDDLASDTKRGLKLELKASYGQISVFPLLIIDGTIPISGFNREKWIKILEI